MQRKRRNMRDLRALFCRRITCYVYARRSHCPAIRGSIMAAVPFESILYNEEKDCSLHAKDHAFHLFLDF